MKEETAVPTTKSFRNRRRVKVDPYSMMESSSFFIGFWCIPMFAGERSVRSFGWQLFLRNPMHQAEPSGIAQPPHTIKSQHVYIQYFVIEHGAPGGGVGREGGPVHQVGGVLHHVTKSRVCAVRELELAIGNNGRRERDGRGRYH